MPNRAASVGVSTSTNDVRRRDRAPRRSATTSWSTTSRRSCSARTPPTTRLSAATQRVGAVAGAHRLEPSVDPRHRGGVARPVAQQPQQRFADRGQVDGEEQRGPRCPAVAQGDAGGGERGERARPRPAPRGRTGSPLTPSPTSSDGLAHRGQPPCRPHGQRLAVDDQRGLVDAHAAAAAPGEQDPGRRRHGADRRVEIVTAAKPASGGRACPVRTCMLTPPTSTGRPTSTRRSESTTGPWSDHSRWPAATARRPRTRSRTRSPAPTRGGGASRATTTRRAGSATSR